MAQPILEFQPYTQQHSMSPVFGFHVLLAGQLRFFDNHCDFSYYNHQFRFSSLTYSILEIDAMQQMDPKKALNDFNNYLANQTPGTDCIQEYTFMQNLFPHLVKIPSLKPQIEDVIELFFNGCLSTKGLKTLTTLHSDAKKMQNTECTEPSLFQHECFFDEDFSPRWDAVRNIALTPMLKYKSFLDKKIRTSTNGRSPKITASHSSNIAHCIERLEETEGDDKSIYREIQSRYNMVIMGSSVLICSSSRGEEALEKIRLKST